MIPTTGTADLNATGTGSSFNWYDQATGGSVLGTGPDFTTPTISSTTSFYVEEVHSYGGGTTYGGKTDNSTGGVYHNTTQWYSFFDVFETCELKSIKVYADGAGDRTLYIEDENDVVVHSEVFTIADGESRVDINWTLAPGMGYKFRVVEGDHGLWRDDNGGEVNYPYNISDLVSITGANTTGSQYYYYFYDWEVEGGSVQCVSDREEVVVTIGTVGIEEGDLINAKVYPNPVENKLTIELEGEFTFKVIDPSGRQLKSGKATDIETFDSSELDSGVYFISIQQKDESSTLKIIRN